MENKKPSYEELEKRYHELENNRIIQIDSDELQSHFFDSSPIPIIVMNSQTLEFIECNQAAANIYGFSSKEDVIGKTPLDVSTLLQYDGSSSEIKAKEYIDTAIREESVVFEWRHQYENGGNWDAEVHLFRFNMDGEILIQFSLIDITNKKRAREALLESEANLTAIIENSLDSVWSIDTNYRINYINDVFRETFKQSFGVQLKKGMSLLDALPEQLRGLWTQRYDRVFNNEQFVFTDKMDLGTNVIYMEIALNPIVLAGKVVGASFYGRDISEQKKAQIKLEESNALRELIMDSIPSFIAWKDRNSVYLGCNKKFAIVSGVETPNNIIGKTDFDLAWKKEEADFFRKYDELVMSTGIPEHHIIEPQLHADGKQAWLDTNKIPLLNNNGNVFGLLGTYEDVTERMETLDALRESEEKFKETSNLLPQLVFEVDLEGKFTYVNKQAYKTFGYTKEELLEGIYIHQCFALEGRGNAVKAIREKVAGTGNMSNEYLGLKKDGTIFPIVIYSNTIIKNKKPVGLRGIVIDITEQKDSEDELVKAKDKAEESDRLKSAFLANMSHEIRTPMNGILGFAELLKSPDTNTEQRSKFIDIIEKSGNRMLNIINNLINISKIEAGLMEIVSSSMNINEQLEYHFTFFNSEAKLKNINLVMDCPLPNEQVEIITDIEKFNSIVTNLIKNAVKFTDKGSISFGYTVKGEFYEFYIRDTGIGISRNALKHVFDRFIQVDASVSSGYEGSGLGLSITKAFVEMLGGSIRVESEIKKGSVFHFTIPVKSPFEENSSTIDEDLDKLDINEQYQKSTILIAEDDEISLMYLMSLIGDSNITILTAKTGREAVEIFKKHKEIKLILMDIKMPEMDGYIAANKIREINDKTPIVAQTAFALPEEREKYSHVFDDYITKPVQVNDLKEILIKFLKKNP
ncbi:PAS domain S-box protein [bacterium]|nr:PAS domain S-box protein [bacterium]